MKRVHIVISGKVQGVFFRSFIKYHAVLLKLKGYVKNTLMERWKLFSKVQKTVSKRCLNYAKKGLKAQR